MNYFRKLNSFFRAILSLGILFVPLFVSAHATPTAYEPENGALVTDAPERIVIHYSERVDVDASGIEIFGPAGNRVDMKDSRVAPEDPRAYSAGITRQADMKGTYTVSWKVLSADDGHFSKGAFSFSVGVETGTATLSVADQFQVVYRSALGEATAVFIELFGVSILLGLCVIYLFILLPLGERGSLLRSFIEERRQVFHRLMLFGVISIIVGTLMYIVVKSLDLVTFQNIGFFEAMRTFSQTVAGSYTLYRTLLACALLGTFFFFKRDLFDPKKVKRNIWILFTFVLVIALLRSRISHAAASHFHPVLSIGMTYIHLLTKEFWAGALWVSMFLFFPLARRPGGGVSVIVYLTAFSRLLAVIFGLVVISGAYMVWLDLKGPYNLLVSDWGIRFILLGILGGVFVATRFFNQLILERKAGLSFASGDTGALNEKLPLLYRSYAFEAMLGVALVAVSSLMVITTPPLAKEGIVEKTLVSQGVELTFAEHRYEEESMLLTLKDTASSLPVTPTTLVVTLFNDKEDIGPIVADTEERSAGGYVFSKTLLSPPGEWRVEVSASRENAYDAVGAFHIDYPKEAEATRIPPESRSIDTFAIVVIVIAFGGILVSIGLYVLGSGFLRTIPPNGNSEETVVISAVEISFWPMAVALLFLVSLWAFSAKGLKNDFQRTCERDGGMWHQMVPMRNNKAVSQLSVRGCMSQSGTFLFADAGEYARFMAPVPVDVKFSTTQKDLIAGATTTLQFFVTATDTEKSLGMDLSISHERFLHVVVVGEDLETFRHVHVEDQGPVTPQMKKDGVFSIPLVFPKAGRYIISLDTVVRAQGFSKQFYVDVGGVPKMTPAPQTIVGEKDLPGGYRVTLKATSDVFAGVQTNLTYEITKDGVPVENLEPYLGAAMHLAVVKSDLSRFIHTHGEVHLPGAPLPTASGANPAMHHAPPPKQFGPKVEAHVTFPEPGLYQVFGQLKHQGKVLLVPFFIKVN